MVSSRASSQSLVVRLWQPLMKFNCKRPILLQNQRLTQKETYHAIRRETPFIYILDVRCISSLERDRGRLVPGISNPCRGTRKVLWSIVKHRVVLIERTSHFEHWGARTFHRKREWQDHRTRGRQSRVVIEYIIIGRLSEAELGIPS